MTGSGGLIWKKKKAGHGWKAIQFGVSFPQINEGYRKNQTSMWIVIAEILGEPFGPGISSFSDVVHSGKYWWVSSNVRNLEYLTSLVVKATTTFFFFFSRRRGVWGIIVRWSCDCHKSQRYKVGCHIHVLHWSTALAVWGSEKKHNKTVQKVYHKYIKRERYVCVIPLNMCVCVHLHW